MEQSCHEKEREGYGEVMKELDESQEKSAVFTVSGEDHRRGGEVLGIMSRGIGGTERGRQPECRIEL